jgi:NAD(P)-dependent dehydrogenase (short-subunit alcohol dehydrogenase family)
VTRTIFITGVSSGLGKSLAQEALAQGWRVVGTVRHQNDLQAFESIAPGRAHGCLLDVRAIERMPGLVAHVEERIGAIDVLVNNAGFGLIATVEEAPLYQIREQFETNVFSAIALLQAVLPYMRKRGAGRILNITSMGGLLAFPGVGIYSASKFAMEGITEALRQEVAEFGIKVTAIEPGLFKTDWAGRSQQHSPESIRDYDALRRRRAAQPMNWNGDLKKAAQAMLTILDDETPPGHLLLGTIADDLVRAKLAALGTEIDRYRPLSRSTDLGPMSGPVAR